MLFNSLEFALFFPLATLAYFAAPRARRWFVSVVAGAVFYMAFIPAYLLILGFTIGIDYLAGICIESTQGRKRRAWLAASLFANVGVLAVFKYYGFLAENIAAISAALGGPIDLPLVDLVLPIGLSFHTLQSLAYTIEVYLGRFPAERHIGYLAAYVLFYPQLLAGPIERPQGLLAQLRHPAPFSYANVAGGLQRMSLGLFKKMVLADQLAPLIDAVHADPQSHHGLAAALAVAFYPFQVYYDFSGYADVARGAAQVMGIHLRINFRAPFTATSFSEFWRRWHVSLSAWLRDYVYIPLGGSHAGALRRSANLMAVFLIGGLWHGPAWTFVVWGGLCGLLVIAGRFTESFRKRVGLAQGGALGTLGTSVLFVLSCLVFRARSLGDAWQIAKNSTVGLPGDLISLFGGGAVVGWSGPGLAVIIAGLGLMLWVDARDAPRDVFARLSAFPGAARFAVNLALVYSCLAAGAFVHPRAFVYFQF